MFQEQKTWTAKSFANTEKFVQILHREGKKCPRFDQRFGKTISEVKILIESSVNLENNFAKISNMQEELVSAISECRKEDLTKVFVLEKEFKKIQKNFEQFRDLTQHLEAKCADFESWTSRKNLMDEKIERELCDMARLSSEWDEHFTQNWRQLPGTKKCTKSDRNCAK